MRTRTFPLGYHLSWTLTSGTGTHFTEAMYRPSLRPTILLQGFEDACCILHAAQAGQSDPGDGWAWVDKQENDRIPKPFVL